jgi:hypothetical protein
MASQREIALVLFDLGEIFGHQLSDRATELYVEALADLSPGQLKDAANILIRAHDHHFPLPAEIREIAKTMPDERAILLPRALDPADAEEKARIIDDLEQFFRENRLGYLHRPSFERLSLEETRTYATKWREKYAA